MFFFTRLITIYSTFLFIIMCMVNIDKLSFVKEDYIKLIKHIIQKKFFIRVDEKKIEFV